MSYPTGGAPPPPLPPFGSGPPPEDDDVFEQEAADNVDELQAEEFPRYFVVVGGRLWPSHPTTPYPLPVDGTEQQRLNVMHNVLREILGVNYFGPVRQLLGTPPPPSTSPSGQTLPSQQQRLVLDFGAGTGRWLMEMGAEFPDTLFAGLDIVPIATRYPLPNVRFELHDINTPSRFPARSVDIVHARFISMTTRNYPQQIVNEAHRVLIQGGLFLSGEWGRYPSFHPSLGIAPLQMEQRIPALCRFHAVLRGALHRRRGIRDVAPAVHTMLPSSHWSDVTPQDYFVPLGAGWVAGDEAHARIGRAVRSAFMRFVRGMERLLLDDGEVGGVQQFEALVARVAAELRRENGLVIVYHTVHARRV